MKQMSYSTVLKLLVPVCYGLLAAIYFILALQNTTPKTHHIVGICVAGLAFILWIVARVQLGNSFSIGAQAKGLVTTGFYSKLRHPVYYFSIAAVVGIAIFTWSVWMILLVILLIIIEIIRIKQEEKILEKNFGKTYLRYKQTTWF